jgi:hypothetical protein
VIFVVLIVLTVESLTGVDSFLTSTTSIWGSPVVLASPAVADSGE